MECPIAQRRLLGTVRRNEQKVLFKKSEIQKVTTTQKKTVTMYAYGYVLHFCFGKQNIEKIR